MIACVLLVPTDRARAWLRRYPRESASAERQCAAQPPVTVGDASSGRTTVIYRGCEARVPHGERRVVGYRDARVEGRPARLVWRLASYSKPRATSPLWATRCAACGGPLPDDAVRQLFWRVLYRRADGQGDPVTLDDAAPGAMWYADWLEDDAGPGDPLTNRWLGPDGRALMVKTPGGDWHIDGVASNCTLPHDPMHRCWMRHGTPPEITVDKAPAGPPPFDRTCSAGAGSIQAGPYHGFLRDGYLT